MVYIAQPECIILAGGLGTRLRGTIGDYPKCMATVNEKPFLQYLLQYLEKQGCSRIILSLGYKHKVVTEWLEKQQFSFAIDYVIETEPLGTGGGIALAMQKAQAENVAVFNGDTMYQATLEELFAFHLAHGADTSIALKEMHDFDRYGVVNVDAADRIISFEEKQYRERGYINGGIYIINKQAFDKKALPEKFSFEKDYLEAFVREGNFYGYKNDSYFIDIGVPEDYKRAEEDFKQLF